MILVVGATGLLGAEICRRLANEEKRSGRWFVRQVHQRRWHLWRSVVVLCAGDLKDTGSLAGAATA